jgi:PAS domain S-box-containing protein
MSVGMFFVVFTAFLICGVFLTGAGLLWRVIPAFMVSLGLSFFCFKTHKKLLTISNRFISELEGKKILESALRNSEERYRAIFEEADHGLILINKEKCEIADFNPRIIAMLGYSAEEFQKLKIDDIVHPAKTRDLKAALISPPSSSSFPDKLTQIKTKMRSKFGDPIDVLLSAKNISIHDTQYILVICNDISSVRSLEKQLHDHLRFSNSLLEAIPSPVFYKNKDGRYMGCNAAFENFTGISRNDLIGKTVFDIAPKDVAEEYSHKDLELLKSPGTQRYDWKIQKKDGTIRDVTFNKATYANRKGEIIGIIGLINDITESMKTTKDLEFAVEKWRETFDAFEELIFVIDKNYKIVLSNKAMKKHFFGEFIDGNFCYKIVHETNAVPERCPCLEVFRTKAPRTLETFNSILNAYLEISYYPVCDESGEVSHLVHLMKDISRQKKMENEIRKNNKMLIAQNKALMKWTNLNNLLNLPLNDMLREIIKDVIADLDVSIAGIWFFNSTREKLICACSYDRKKQIFQSGEEFNTADFSVYFDTILKDRIVSADNAHTDPGTLEFIESYLLPRGINSMLDVLISIGTEPLGILCSEHTGPPRNWLLEESNYVLAMANIISLYFQSIKNEHIEDKLDDHINRFDSLTGHSNTGIIIKDDSDKIIYVNRTAEIFFADKIKNMLGEKCREEILDATETKKIKILRHDKSIGVGIISSESCTWDKKDARIFTVKDVTDII